MSLARQDGGCTATLDPRTLRLVGRQYGLVPKKALALGWFLTGALCAVAVWGFFTGLLLLPVAAAVAGVLRRVRAPGPWLLPLGAALMTLLLGAALLEETQCVHWRGEGSGQARCLEHQDVNSSTPLVIVLVLLFLALLWFLADSHSRRTRSE